MNTSFPHPSRRELLALGATAVTAAAVSSIGFSAGAQQAAAEVPVPFSLPPLAYPHEAMEPHIDALTMRIHHEKHHGAFVTNLNKLATTHAVLATTPTEKLLADQCALVPEAVRTPVRNNLGGHHNHSLF